MRLLIVDDEAHIRQMMRLTLEAAKYEVEEAASGEDALVRFGEGTGYDAVLLDQKMPGLDGLQTLARIKERNPEACVIMVTAFASIDLAVDAMRLGATDFLRKPMTPEMLRGAVAGALASRPRAPLKQAAMPGRAVPLRVETLTLNGFRILGSGAPTDASIAEHVFTVKHFPGGGEVTVVVSIDPDAVARVARLSRHALQSGGAFWRQQAERALSAYLWSHGEPPEPGRLTVRDVSREDLDAAAAWPAD